IGVWTMVQRVYFAFEDTRFLFFVQIPMALLQILGSLASFLLLDVHYWVVGAGVATTASNTIDALVGYLALRRKLPTLDGARVLRTHLRVLLATVPSVAAGWGLLHLWGVQTSFVGALARVVPLGALMALIYYILLRRLPVAELDQLCAGLAQRRPGRWRGATPLARGLSHGCSCRGTPLRARAGAGETGSGGARARWRPWAHRTAAKRWRRRGAAVSFRMMA